MATTKSKSQSRTTAAETKTTSVYSNFINACKSDATKIAYAKALRYFIGFMGLPADGYNQLLEKGKDIKIRRKT